MWGVLQQFSINSHLTRKYKDSKNTSHHLGNVHKSHLIKHKSLVSEIRVQKAFSRWRWDRFIYVVKKHICARTPLFHSHLSPSNKLSAKYTGTTFLNSYSYFPRSHHNTSVACHFKNMLLLCCVSSELKEKLIPTTFKWINKCIEKENGHRLSGFYSECHDAGENTECPWRAKMRAAENKRAHRVIRQGHSVLTMFRPLHLSAQQLLDF